MTRTMPVSVRNSGPTRMSRGPEPVPASEVNLAGRITGDAALLRKAKGQGRIRLEKS